ncbi:MAG TPA: ClpXP protease specificity-enhancing factor [Rhodanobacteraceae bacterium]|nr:ClpXP protease specificity-enhancing factor [Rhodanobacteraceae bacterium]
MADQPAMTSNRPYLLRAVYDWISDNGLTPYILVDAAQPGVRVPAHTIRDGRVVLNLAMRAVTNLELGNERIGCLARFGGVSHAIDVPIEAVMAIYAHENGQGMMFPREEAGVPQSSAESQNEQRNETQQSGETASQTLETSGSPPPKGPPKLRVIK